MDEDRCGALLREYFETGRESAVERLVAATRPRLLAAARRIGAPQDAEDAVQTAYFSLLRRRDPLDAPVLPWLLRAVIRITYRRKAVEHRQHALANRLEAPHDDPSPAAAAASAEERTRVRAQVDRLPARYRDALVLHYLEGLSTPEIAALQEVPEPTVRTRLRRGRELLRGPLAPLWKFAVLALPWFARDAVATTGGLVVKKKTALAGALLLLALFTTGVVVTLSDTRAPAPRAPSVSATQPGVRAPADEAIPPPEPPSRPAVTGVVLDSGGHPVEGAEVRTHTRVEEQPPFSFDSLFEDSPARARTGAAGRFRVELGDDAQIVDLVVSARGHSPARVNGVRDGVHVEVRLRPAPALSGAVRDLEGDPVGRARIAWWVLADGVRVERRTVANADGEYRIADLPSPEAWNLGGLSCTVAVRADGYAPVVTQGPPLHRGCDPELHFDLWLAPGAVIEGRIVDVETREPLPHARVILSGVVPGGIVDYEETRADGEGRFVLREFPVDGFHRAPGRGVGEGRCLGWVAVEQEGYARATAQVGVPESGDSLHVEVECWPTAVVRGRVVDGTGHGVPGANVSGFRDLGPVASSPGMRQPWAKTDREGRFEWTDVPALRGESSRLQVRAHREGWEVQRVQVDIRAARTTVVPDFVFDGPPHPSVIAEVVDERGEPVAGARVGVHPALAKRTGPDGRARLFATPDPESRLAARSASSGLCLSEPFLPSADTPPVVRIVLDATHSVEGMVRDTTGAPVAAATVSAWSSWQALGHTRSDREGRFRLGRLPAGVIDLTAGRGARSTRIEGVPVDAPDLRVVLPAPAPVRSVPIEGLVVDDATGRRILRFTALLLKPEHLRGERIAPGAFRFPRVAEGRWLMLVAADGYAQHWQHVVVDTAAPPPSLRIELVRGVTVLGWIKAERGCVLVLYDDHGLPQLSASLQSRGRYRIDGATPGRWWPAVQGDEPRAVVPSPLVIPEEEDEVVVDLELVSAGTLVLRGAGPTDRVEVTDTEGRNVWMRIGCSDGDRVHLPPGVYRVGEREVSVARGEAVEVRLGE